MQGAESFEEYLAMTRTPANGYDDTPTDEQRAMMAGGAFMIKRADPDGGVPLGESPDDVAGTRIVIDPNEAGHGHVITISGRNDPILKEVFDRYALQAGPDKTPAERKAAADAALTEIVAAKARAGLAAGPGVLAARPPAQPPPPTGRPTVRVMFEYGGVDGTRPGEYSDVVIDGNVLAVITERDRVSGMYIPPALPPPQTVTLRIEGLEAPVRVFSTGTKYSYRGDVHMVFFIDRDGE